MRAVRADRDGTQARDLGVDREVADDLHLAEASRSEHTGGAVVPEHRIALLNPNDAAAVGGNARVVRGKGRAGGQQRCRASLQVAQVDLTAVVPTTKLRRDAGC